MTKTVSFPELINDRFAEIAGSVDSQTVLTLKGFTAPEINSICSAAGKLGFEVCVPEVAPLDGQHPWVLKNGVILHSDQGSQYTSKEFTDYCSAHNLTQSMSRAGCPYDNSPMERYFNTLKSKLIYHHSYSCEDKLFSDIEDYVLLWYNSVRPHSLNNGLTPWQKRLA